MITKLRLENFKSYQDETFTFDDSRLHGLVGQNSSGKSSVLQALYCLGGLIDSPSSEVFRQALEPGQLLSRGQNKMRLCCFGLWGDLNDQQEQNWKLCYHWNQDSDYISWRINGEASINLPEEAPRALPDAICVSLANVIHLKLIDSNLAKPAYSNDLVPRMAFDGSGLGPTLDYLSREKPDAFEKLETLLKRIVPGVERIRIKRARVPVNRQRSVEIDGKSIFYEESQELIGQEVWLDMKSGKAIQAQSISEGTLLAIGLLTVLLTPESPKLVLLDDIEQGLHPRAQRELMAVLQEIVASDSDLQIIFTTHSPYIIDELEPSQVHVLNIEESGFTRSKRLDEHPDIEWAKNTLTTGEFWGAEGEEWIADKTEEVEKPEKAAVE